MPEIVKYRCSKIQRTKQQHSKWQNTLKNVKTIAVLIDLMHNISINYLFNILMSHSANYLIYSLNNQSIGHRTNETAYQAEDHPLHLCPILTDYKADHLYMNE